MLLTESEGKSVLSSAGIEVPEGFLARTARQIARSPVPYPVAVKVQVASGGRGKAGGVAKATSAEEATAAAERMFGTRFGGELPRAVLVDRKSTRLNSSHT